MKDLERVAWLVENEVVCWDSWLVGEKDSKMAVWTDGKKGGRKGIYWASQWGIAKAAQ